MDFGTIKWRRNKEQKQNYVTWANFIFCIKAEDFHIDIEKDVEPKFDTLNYKLE